MADPRHALGTSAEELVAGWLVPCGWRILALRHRAVGGGEVDLIALDPAGTLVAIEVRARRSGRTGRALDSVDARRIARQGRTLTAFAATSGERHTGLRIDLVSVEPMPGERGRWRLSRLPGIG